MPESIAYSGWVQLLVQSGSLGLLWYVVVKLAPRWMQEARDERDKNLAAAQTERDAAREERLKHDLSLERIVEMMQAKFEERSRDVTASIKDQTGTFVRALERQGATISTALDASSARIENAVSTACKIGEQHQAQPLSVRRKADGSKPAPPTPRPIPKEPE